MLHHLLTSVRMSSHFGNQAPVPPPSREAGPGNIPLWKFWLPIAGVWVAVMLVASLPLDDVDGARLAGRITGAIIFSLVLAAGLSWLVNRGRSA